jgi:hypothetical protein
MKHRDERAKMLLTKMLVVRLCGCLLLAAVVAGCGNNANVSNADNRSQSTSSSRTQDNGGATAQPTSDDSGAVTQQTAGSKAEEACRKYESCGCQAFAQCMEQIGNDPSIEAGIGDCMIKSSCQSLCAGKPDGCPKTSTGPQKSNCSAIPCSKNSDCPSDCYGGCDGVICYAF